MAASQFSSSVVVSLKDSDKRCIYIYSLTYGEHEKGLLSLLTNMEDPDFYCLWTE